MLRMLRLLLSWSLTVRGMGGARYSRVLLNDASMSVEKNAPQPVRVNAVCGMERTDRTIRFSPHSTFPIFVRGMPPENVRRTINRAIVIRTSE